MTEVLPYSPDDESDVNHVGDICRSVTNEPATPSPQPEQVPEITTRAQAEEENLRVMRIAGNSWSEIERTFPMHTESSVKKHWYKDMYYTESGNDGENHPTRSDEPLYLQTISPHLIKSLGVSETRSHAPHVTDGLSISLTSFAEILHDRLTNYIALVDNSGKIQIDRMDEDIVKTGTVGEPHSMPSGRTPQYPTKFSATKGAGQEISRVAILPQRLFQYIRTTAHGIANSRKANRDHERPTSPADSNSKKPSLLSETNSPANSATSADNVDDVVESEVSTVRDCLCELLRTALCSRDPSLVESGVEPKASSHRRISDFSGLTKTGRVRKAGRGKPEHGCAFCDKVYTRPEHVKRHQALDHKKELASYKSQGLSTILSPPPPSPSKESSSCKDSLKRSSDGTNGQDDRGTKKRRDSRDDSEPSTRLACLYNKYDPMMYRSNSQTDKKFGICGTHDFQNMNKLYEHLKRVHSDQPLQCPRCTSTDFESSEELQAHQTSSEPCVLVSTDTVKRIQWITHDERIGLQSAISRRLRGCTDEEKWRFAYRWLFRDTDPHDTPSPYLQDPVISIVSSVTDDYEMRLRELIRQCKDLSDLKSQLPMIRRQLLAQYGVSTNEVEQEPPPSSSLVTVVSTGSRRPLAVTPQNVVEPQQSSLDTVNHQDQLVFSPTTPTPSPHQPPTSTPAYNHGPQSRMNESLTTDVTQPRYQPTQAATALQYQPTGYGDQDGFYQMDPSVSSLNIPSDIDWLQEEDFAWVLDADTSLPTDILGSKGDMPDDFLANNEFGTGS